MAQYLTVALKLGIVVSKKNLQIANINAEIALNAMVENLDLSIYEYAETDHFHLWKLNQSLLENEIMALTESILTFYYGQDEANFSSLLGQIRRSKTYEGLLKMAKESEYEHFVLDNKQQTQIHLPKNGKHLLVDRNFIQFLKSERLRMDYFDKTMRFLENCTQKAFSEFELSKALSVYVFDAK